MLFTATGHGRLRRNLRQRPYQLQRHNLREQRHHYPIIAHRNGGKAVLFPSNEIHLRTCDGILHSSTASKTSPTEPPPKPVEAFWKRLIRKINLKLRAINI